MHPVPVQQPDLSICLVTWNVRDYLRDCLLSLRRARPEIDYEVLVVDNRSSDGTAVSVKTDFPEVSLIQNDRNRGFAAACNQAIRSSGGRYLLLLNPDTLVPAGSLEEMVRFLDQHPGAGGAGPKLINPDGSLQPSVRGFPTTAAAFRQFTILGDLGLFGRARSVYLQTNFDYQHPAVVDQPMGAALFLRRQALEEVGMLDEGFFLYFEEVDLCRRLSRAGWTVWYNPAAEIVHRGGESTRQEGGRSLLYFFQSQFRYFAKTAPPLRAHLFKLAFKPLAVLGIGWSMMLSGVGWAAGRLFGISPERGERKRVRFNLKKNFLTHQLLKFLRL